jgi:hypothetical protein
VQFFRRQKGESLTQIKAFLSTKHGISTSASAVGFKSALIKNEAEEAVILLHGTFPYNDGFSTRTPSFC